MNNINKTDILQLYQFGPVLAKYKLEDNFVEEPEEEDEVYFDLRNLSSSANGKNGTLRHTVTQPPFGKKNLRNRFNEK